MRGVHRHLLKRERDQALDGRVADLPWRTRARCLDQPFEPVLGETPAPRRHRGPADTKRLGDTKVGGARLGAGQDNPSALGQGLADVAPPDQVVQRRPLRIRQLERHSLDRKSVV